MARMTEANNNSQGVLGEDECIRLLSDELYASLRRIARSQRGRMRAGETMQTTALVSETYIKLSRQSAWKSREHFLNTAARVMRQVLVDYARAQLAAKRGGGESETPIDEVEMLLGESSEQVLNIDMALTRLQQIDPRLAQVVECRFFAGYGDAETARVLDISVRTVQRDWLKARAWLYQELDAAPPR
jgi:RNA polymerase sigma factor (TIGR02999 family)